MELVQSLWLKNSLTEVYRYNQVKKMEPLLFHFFIKLINSKCFKFHKVFLFKILLTLFRRIPNRRSIGTFL
jgi:hypothetical protein